MSDLLDILIEVLVEADPQKDLQMNSTVDKYMGKINGYIGSYQNNNDKVVFRDSKGTRDVEVHLPDLNVLITNRVNNASGGTKAQFYPTKQKGVGKPLLVVYDASIETDPKLTVKFDENSLRHELVHFLDFGRVKTDPDKIGTSQNKAVSQQGMKGYYNAPLESNAHFFELFVPEILKYLQKEKEMPENYNDFKNGLLQNPDAKNFYDHLDDKNKRKLEKRLGTYYTSVLKNPNFKIEEPGNKINTNKLVQVSKNFWNKIKDKFKPAA